MSKYKITIGSRVFDAESNGDGTFQMKNGNRDFTMSAVGIEVLDGKIEEIKEPLRFEANVVWKACGGFAYPEGNANWHQLVGKKGKIMFVESIPAQCEHTWFYNDRCEYRCKKCGVMKL